MLRCAYLCAAVLFGLSLGSARLSAQEAPKQDASYIAIKLGLGFGGSRTVRSNAVSVGGNMLTSSMAARNEDDLNVTFGIAGQYMVPLHDYFVLGGLLGLSTWQSSAAGNNDASRNLLVDLAIVPQGRYPIGGLLELYVALPLSLALDAWNEVDNGANVGGLVMTSAKGNTAIGFGISLLLGARTTFSNSFGMLTELGYSYHGFSHTITYSGNLFPTTKVDASLHFGQLVWNLGVFF